MNRTNLRWKIYKLLRKREVIPKKRGGYSIKGLYTFILAKYDLEMEIYSDPYLALKELTFCETLESL